MHSKRWKAHRETVTKRQLNHQWSGRLRPHPQFLANPLILNEATNNRSMGLNTIWTTNNAMVSTQNGMMNEYGKQRESSLHREREFATFCPYSGRVLLYLIWGNPYDRRYHSSTAEKLWWSKVRQQTNEKIEGIKVLKCSSNEVYGQKTHHQQSHRWRRYCWQCQPKSY